MKAVAGKCLVETVLLEFEGAESTVPVVGESYQEQVQLQMCPAFVGHDQELCLRQVHD